MIKMYKINKISNPILTKKSFIGKNIFIWGKEIQIWMIKYSMRILVSLINFIENLFARKINFWSQFGC
jgi:hypothetical protein